MTSLLQVKSPESIRRLLHNCDGFLEYLFPQFAQQHSRLPYLFLAGPRRTKRSCSFNCRQYQTVVYLLNLLRRKFQSSLSSVPFRVFTLSPNATFLFPLHSRFRKSLGFPSSRKQDAVSYYSTEADPGQPGRGSVFVTDTEKYNLQPGQPYPWGRYLLHQSLPQLHCLAEIRKYHYLMLDSCFLFVFE